MRAACVSLCVCLPSARVIAALIGKRVRVQLTQSDVLPLVTCAARHLTRVATSSARALDAHSDLLKIASARATHLEASAANLASCQRARIVAISRRARARSVVQFECDERQFATLSTSLCLGANRARVRPGALARSSGDSITARAIKRLHRVAVVATSRLILATRQCSLGAHTFNSIIESATRGSSRARARRGSWQRAT